MRTALLNPKTLVNLEREHDALEYKGYPVEGNQSTVALAPSYIESLGFEAASNVSPMPVEPWKPFKFWKRTQLENASLHNGPDPIWIEELQQYLGVGHFKRGAGDSTNNRYCKQYMPNHHYSHLFFTMSSSFPARMERIGSTEFCMLSDRKDATDPDCDSIQYVSTLLLEGDILHVGYGVLDIKSRVMSLKMKDVLASLRELPPIVSF